MSGSTLNTDELDSLLLVSGILHANPETRGLSHALLGIVKRQRALGTVPTVSAQQVADRVGDPALARKFGPTDADNAQWQREAERIGMPELGKLCPKLQKAQRIRTMKERNATADAIEAAQDAADDARRGPMLPGKIRFRNMSPGPNLGHVFEAERQYRLGRPETFRVIWRGGAAAEFTETEVASKLRRKMWMPTHDEVDPQELTRSQRAARRGC